jgi:hypothetical protein
MSAIARALAVAVALSLPTFARAHGPHGIPRQAVVYYPAAPVYLKAVIIEYAQPVPLYLAVPILIDCPPAAPVPAVQAQRLPPTGSGWAPATPAPPSTGPVPAGSPAPATPPGLPPPPPAVTPDKVPPPPAPGTPPPAVRESHAFTNTFDVCGVPPRTGEKPAPDRCSVGFWNLTSQELTLKVDGQTRTLPAGQSLTLDLGRKFVWQIVGRDPQTTTVAAADVGAEIIIRR